MNEENKNWGPLVSKLMSDETTDWASIPDDAKEEIEKNIMMPYEDWRLYGQPDHVLAFVARNLLAKSRNPRIECSSELRELMKTESSKLGIHLK